MPAAPTERPSIVSTVFRSALVRETAFFALTSGVGSIVSAVAAALLARHLSVAQYGNFSFSLSFLMFSAMFFDFGLSGAASRMLARSQEKHAREILATSLMLFLPIGAFYAAMVFALAPTVDRLFNVNAGASLRATAPLAIAYALVPITLQLAQGMNRLNVYSITSASGQLLFLGLLALAVHWSVSLGVTTPLAIRGAALLMAAVSLAVWLRPVFANFGSHARLLIEEVRSYGFQVYLGRLIGIGTYNMDVLMVAAWTDSHQVGLYSLAGAIAAAVGLPVTGLSIALFPRLVQREALDRRWLAIASTAGLAGLILLWLFHELLLRLFFSEPYTAAGAFIVPLAAAQAVRGVTGIYNSFLAAHGRGKELRSAAIVLTVSNLVLNFALIPPFGALGAAWASLFALLANLWAHVTFYRRSLRIAEGTA